MNFVDENNFDDDGSLDDRSKSLGSLDEDGSLITLKPSSHHMRNNRPPGKDRSRRTTEDTKFKEKYLQNMEDIKLEMRKKADAIVDLQEMQLFTMKDEDLPPDRKRYFELKRKAILRKLEETENKLNNKKKSKVVNVDTEELDLDIDNDEVLDE